MKKKDQKPEPVLGTETGTLFVGYISSIATLIDKWMIIEILCTVYHFEIILIKSGRHAYYSCLHFKSTYYRNSGTLMEYACSP